MPPFENNKTADKKGEGVSNANQNAIANNTECLISNLRTTDPKDVK
jgi:hypothetical protein